MITIRDEIAHVQSYLTIQGMRYQDKFNYLIDIDPELHKYPILKITLQPLVENAIYHGIKENNQKGFIRISYLDQTSTDQSAQLKALEIGDTVRIASVTWAVQSVLDQPADSYVEVGIAPPVQGQFEGVQAFTFSAHPDVTLSYDIDADYYLGNAEVSGLFGSDVSWEDTVENDNAYGVDILVIIEPFDQQAA